MPVPRLLDSGLRRRKPDLSKGLPPPFTLAAFPTLARKAALQMAMNVGETLKNVACGLGFLLVIAAVFGLGIIFIVGATAVSYWVKEWIPYVFWINLLIAFFILGPLSLIPPARFIAAIGFVIASFVFGAMMWFCGLGVTYEAWGVVGVIIGLMIAGVGIVPVGMLAVLLQGEWQALIAFVILILLTFGLRALGFWLAKKVDERTARLSFQREMQAA
jgi:hypothetical protein